MSAQPRTKVSHNFRVSRGPPAGKIAFGKGVGPAPDYKALYFELFRASEQAARLLREAQARAEQEVLRADEPPLRLSEPPEKPDGDA